MYPIPEWFLPLVQVAVYVDGGQTYIDSPRAAHHIVEIEHGEVIDIVVQNLKANANGTSRNA